MLGIQRRHPVAIEKTPNKNEDEKIAKDLEKAEPPKPRFGGHVGVVVPIVTRGDGNTVTLAEDFIIGFPSVSPSDKQSGSFRFRIHSDDKHAIKSGLLIPRASGHCLYLQEKLSGWSAWRIKGTGNYGFTPIVARSFKLTEKINYFIEADLPVRWENRPDGSEFTSVQFALHTGINF